MKMIIGKDHKNAKGKKWKDTDKLRRYNKIKVGSTSPKDDPGSRDIEFGDPWIVHTYDPYDFTQGDQEIYEGFCCGYLLYFDLQNSTEHSIYFVWEKDTVSLYLFPSAVVGVIDPQPPPAPPPPPRSL